MPGMRKKWAIPFNPDPINQAWVQEQLAKRGITCEVKVCNSPAELALEGGNDEVPLVCKKHYDLLVENWNLRLRVERQLWDEFDLMFNFVRRVEETGGQLLVDMERAWKENEAAEKEMEKLRRQAARATKRALKKSSIRVGSPDDALVGRDAQSPSHSRPVIRWPEPIKVEPVRLTLFPDEQPLLMGMLLPFEPAEQDK